MQGSDEEAEQAIIDAIEAYAPIARPPAGKVEDAHNLLWMHPGKDDR